MKDIKLEQQVKLFSDQEKMGNQSVNIDLNDENEPWINVIHDGNEISLSLENWIRLMELAYQAVEKLEL